MRFVRALLLVCVCTLIFGCKANQRTAAEYREPPTYESIASIYNERINAMPSIWARGVVSFRFTNEQGKRQNEQGNCYLHVVRPHNISFIINKLEQQYVRLGCNERLYWAMDLQEKTVRTGDHTNGGAGGGGRIDQFGLPLSPDELLTVFALAPLPDPDGHQSVAWSDDAKHLIITHPSALGVTVYALDPATYLPQSVELIEGDSGRVLVRADFTKPLRTPVPGQGAYSRQVPGQIDIRDMVNDSHIKITFGSASATREIDPDNFNLEHLLDVLGPFKIIDP